MKKIITTLAIIAITASFAQETKPPRKGTPPQEAITVCQNEIEGAECSIDTPRGDTLTGTCQNTPDKKYFACKPNHDKGERSK